MVLGELLRKFKRYLGELAGLELKEPRPPQSEFDIALRNVGYYGEALQLLAGGVAIQRHLQVIEDKLMDFHHKRARDVANQAATPMLMNRGALCAPKDAFSFIFAFTKL